MDPSQHFPNSEPPLYCTPVCCSFSWCTLFANVNVYSVHVAHSEAESQPRGLLLKRKPAWRWANKAKHSNLLPMQLNSFTVRGIIVQYAAQILNARCTSTVCTDIYAIPSCEKVGFNVRIKIRGLYLNSKWKRVVEIDLRHNVNSYGMFFGEVMKLFARGMEMVISRRYLLILGGFYELIWRLLMIKMRKACFELIL